MIYDVGRGIKKNPPKGKHFLENISPCLHHQPFMMQAGVLYCRINWLLPSNSDIRCPSPLP